MESGRGRGRTQTHVSLGLEATASVVWSLRIPLTATAPLRSRKSGLPEDPGGSGEGPHRLEEWAAQAVAEGPSHHPDTHEPCLSLPAGTKSALWPASSQRRVDTVGSGASCPNLLSSLTAHPSPGHTPSCRAQGLWGEQGSQHQDGSSRVYA